jgi:NitT/TauT family transport system substrate-binding protein
MARRTFGAVLGAATLAVGLLLPGCGDGGSGDGPGDSGSDGGANGPAKTPVTIGAIAILDVAPLYLGVRKGFFAGRGLDLKIETAQGGAVVISAVLSGQYQFGFSNNTSLLLGQTRGLPVRIVAPGSSSTNRADADFAGVVVPNASPIRSAADLAGKSVAINLLNNISDTVVRESVRKAGGDPKSVRFVELAFPDMPAALARGRVDAAFVVEPFFSIAKAQGARNVVSAYAETTANLSVATYFTSEQLRRSRPGLVKSFTEAMVESQNYASTHPDEARQILTTYTQIDPAVIRSLTLPAYPAEVNRGSVQVLADLALRDGLVKKAPDVAALFPS